MKVSFSQRDILQDLLKLFETDIKEMKKQAALISLPPYTDALLSVQESSDWHALALALKKLDPDWRKKLSFLTDLDIKNTKGKIYE